MIRLVLPWPPSENHYRRNVMINGSSRTLISKRGREFQSIVCDRVRQQGSPKITGRLAVSICAMPPDRRRRDLDNLLKAACDSIQRAGVIRDDGDIDRLLIERGDRVEGGRLVVFIEEITP